MEDANTETTAVRVAVEALEGSWRPCSDGRGVMPGMQFNSGDHTNSLVPLYAKGAAARLLKAGATGTDDL